MKPFFCYFGGKYRVAAHYPPPSHATVVEPFAGAAGYATRWYTPKLVVKLYELDPIICSLWDYLIKVRPAEIRRLPLVVEHTDDLRCCMEAKVLIGFWLNKGTVGVHRVPSSRSKSGDRPNSHWGEVIRERIATQVALVKQWTIKQSSYEKIPNIRATWFIDPPYSVRGCVYPCSSVNIDYIKLGAWSRGRKGQVIVCENDGAKWLPFKHFRNFHPTVYGDGQSHQSVEVVWTNKERVTR
jgi:hypothetical protein